MFAFPSFFRAGLLVLACLALSGPARATGMAPALKISYSLATLSEAQGREDSQADLWERIRAGFSLPESDPRLTRIHEQWYGKNPRHLERAIQRSRLYLFHIVEEVEKRGMPMEIALLPMIESAFNPQAPRRAEGYPRSPRLSANPASHVRRLGTGPGRLQLWRGLCRPCPRTRPRQGLCQSAPAQRDA